MKTVLKIAIKIGSLLATGGSLIDSNILLEDGVSNLLREDGSFLLQE